LRYLRDDSGGFLFCGSAEGFAPASAASLANRIARSFAVRASTARRSASLSASANGISRAKRAFRSSVVSGLKISGLGPFFTIQPNAKFGSPEVSQIRIGEFVARYALAARTEAGEIWGQAREAAVARGGNCEAP
jgi:hypothetical protein